jgi:predicted transcriptional regulator
MRITVTLDDDVAARLKQLSRQRRVSFTALVTEAPQAGLERLDSSRAARRFRTRGFDLGRSLVGSLDNIEDILSR